MPTTEVNVINSTFANNIGHNSKAALSIGDFVGIPIVEWCHAGAGAFARDARLVIVNSIFARNTPEGRSDQVGGFDDRIVASFALLSAAAGLDDLVECYDGRQVFWERSAYGFRLGIMSTSCVQDLRQFAGFGNVDSGDLRLQPGSSCVDAGNNFIDFDSFTPGFQFAPETDIDGRGRIVDGNGDGDAIIDMGAHELSGQ